MVLPLTFSMGKVNDKKSSIVPKHQLMYFTISSKIGGNNFSAYPMHL